MEFKKVETREIAAYLKKIAVEGRRRQSRKPLKELAARSDGDVRGALNDLADSDAWAASA